MKAYLLILFFCKYLALVLKKGVIKNDGLEQSLNAKYLALVFQDLNSQSVIGNGV